MFKYWTKVRVTSWFYEGMYWTAYKIVSSIVMFKDQPLSYALKLDRLPDNDNIVIISESNLEIIN